MERHVCNFMLMQLPVMHVQHLLQLDGRTMLLPEQMVISMHFTMDNYNQQQQLHLHKVLMQGVQHHIQLL